MLYEIHILWGHHILRNKSGIQVKGILKLIFALALLRHTHSLSPSLGSSAYWTTAWMIFNECKIVLPGARVSNERMRWSRSNCNSWARSQKSMRTDDRSGEQKGNWNTGRLFILCGSTLQIYASVGSSFEVCQFPVPTRHPERITWTWMTDWPGPDRPNNAALPPQLWHFHFCDQRKCVVPCLYIINKASAIVLFLWELNIWSVTKLCSTDSSDYSVRSLVLLQ